MSDAAAIFARAVPSQVDLTLVAPETSVDDQAAAAAMLEGAALARYVYRIGADGPEAKLSSFTLVTEQSGLDAADIGLAQGQLLVRATKLAPALGLCHACVERAITSREQR